MDHSISPAPIILRQMSVSFGARSRKITKFYDVTNTDNAFTISQKHELAKNDAKMEHEHQAKIRAEMKKFISISNETKRENTRDRVAKCRENKLKGKDTLKILLD